MRLIKRAKLAARLLRFVPFLRMAALNGSIVRGEDTPFSDIDILIIGKAGRLYTCRAFATALIHLTGWRRHGKKVAGRICLNCYLADQHLSIIPRNKKSIPKVVRAYKYMIPLVDDGVSWNFFRKNCWFSEHEIKGTSHSENLKTYCFARYPLRPKKIIEKTLAGSFGDIIEKKLMNYQTRRMMTNKQKGDEIFANKDEIRLHPRKHQ